MNLPNLIEARKRSKDKVIKELEKMLIIKHLVCLVD